jgi:uncharacterized membrane protein YvlD (DUF360 family)
MFPTPSVSALLYLFIKIVLIVSICLDLLQELALTYYAPMYSDNIRDNGFRGSDFWVRLVAIIILFIVSWLIQYIIQDILVAKLYGLYISYVMKKNAQAVKNSSLRLGLSI